MNTVKIGAHRKLNQEEIEMTVTAKISQKGQITVPAQIRRILGVGEGDNVRFEVTEGRVMVVGIKKRTISSIIGLLPLDHDMPSIEELRESARDEMAKKYFEGVSQNDT